MLTIFYSRLACGLQVKYIANDFPERFVESRGFCKALDGNSLVQLHQCDLDAWIECRLFAQS